MAERGDAAQAQLNVVQGALGQGGAVAFVEVLQGGSVG
jgi:hypothetical protein